MPLHWLCKHFDSLTLQELYAILQLRSEVFVVEQHCPFQDADNRDHFSYHLMGWENGLLAAYSRLLPADTAFHEVSIGRIVTSPKMRYRGLGKELMRQSISRCFTLFGKQPVRIGAQLYLKKFYESFGFEQDSAVYTEDGIDHIEMVLHIKRD